MDSQSATDAQQVIEELLEDRRETFEEDQQTIRKMYQLCESPPEQLFLAHFLSHISDIGLGHARTGGRDNPHVLMDQWAAPHVLGVLMRFWPQYSIQTRLDGQLRTYRLDFALICSRWTWDPGTWQDLAKIAIEIDGHDFHERTKQQAHRDKLRDRALANEGFTVLRFSGSDIHRDPRACAEQVVTIADKRLMEAFRMMQRPPD